ncbi:MAG: hypothetical protein B7Y75_06580 [Azorhizobium sp. 35-67-5]|nr:MAG: hypothetical protein B7Y75_06580 [Azorhizobium sp. 35-67-5]
MNSDNVTGMATEAGGRVKEAAGAITGSNSLRGEGLYDQAVGGAQRAYGDAKDMAKEGTRKVSRTVEDKPMSAILVAGLAGFVVGFLIAR